jgi:hypothetical protein
VSVSRHWGFAQRASDRQHTRGGNAALTGNKRAEGKAQPDGENH